MHWDLPIRGAKVFDGSSSLGRVLDLAIGSGRVAALGVAVAALGAAASEPARPEVYVHTGEHGEVSFTDEAVPGSERVTLDPVEPPPDAPEQVERRIRQNLEVARALEASRLAREKARAEARTRAEARDRAAARAAPQAAPEVLYRDHYLSQPSVFGPPFDRRFHDRGRFHQRDRFERFDKFANENHDRHDRATRQRTTRKKFPYEPD